MTARKLTAKQDKFCRVLVERGTTAADAYRAAYDCQKSKPATAQRRAHDLLKDSKIAARIEQLRERAAKAVCVTVENHLIELAALRDEARALGAMAPAVTAEMARGKVAGHYTERHEHKVERLDWKALLGNEPGAGSSGRDGTDAK